MPLSPSKQSAFVSETSKQKRVRYVYSALLYVLLPFAALLLIFKSFKKSKAYRFRLHERFGFIPKAKQNGGLLFHCVSVGEVNTAACVIKSILASHPNIPITLTCTTPTGSDRIQELFGDTVLHFYLPFDTPYFVSKLLRRIQPSKVIIAEVELWPNLIHGCWKRNIPSILMNGRMTTKALNNYLKYPNLFTPMCQKLSYIFPQSELDYANYLKIDVNARQLSEAKNIKFDQTVMPSIGKEVLAFQQQIHDQERTVIIGASTHQGEEDFCLNLYKTLKPKFPNLLLVIVPRHPERFPKVENAIRQGQYQCITWQANVPISTQTDVLLVDAMGKLNQVYSLGHIAFVGGSLVKKGGHNPLEAAQFSMPIIMGPHIFNNAEIVESLEGSGALHIVEDDSKASALVESWLLAPELAKQQGKAGAQILAKNKGAIDKTLMVILEDM